ncbi:predicted protein [Nematostella vectensis]|uniref:Proteasome inhibitor PI31 subunit n=1 Tax=Nematostella vectensis TaxID=45351 RepID=A7SGK3_NEMVE|nr:predicted protein [Nematostella vectensis]|eukprot:XP_001629215.1 predicted protein [Nematostella vectensis]
MAEAKLRNLLKIIHLRNKYDAVVVAIHACLLDREFKCVASGNQRNPSDEFDFGEMLPPDWNQSDDSYSLQYKHHNTGPLYILSILKLGNALAIYLLEEDESKMYDITVNVDDFTDDDLDYTTLQTQPSTSINQCFQQFDRLRAKLSRDVIDKFTKPRTQAHGHTNNQDTSRRQPSQGNPSRLLETDPLRLPPRRPPDFRDEWAPPVGPFPYGEGDRSPGFPGGGGMLMDPFRTGRFPRVPGGPTGPNPPGQIPRGSVPPGARFDPFGPIPPDGEVGARPGNPPGRFAGPDPDHLPPPGYDDMFM